MKKNILVAGTLVFMLTACNQSKPGNNSEIVGLDTSTALLQNNVLADTAVLVVKPGTSVEKVIETKAPDGTVTTVTTTTKPLPSPAHEVTHTLTPAATSSTAVAVQPAATATVPARTGWSSRAKGAAIGGVGGAVAGAIISKKKGKGAVIGGLAGAAGGYIIGNEKDKKNGR